MDWKTKAKIQNAVSLLPPFISYEVYYWIQRYFGRLKNLTPISGLNAGLRIGEIISELGKTFDDKVFLEVGTGRRINTPLALWLCGAKKIITVDVNPYLKLELIRNDIKYICENHETISEMLGDNVIRERFEELLSLGKKEVSLDSLLDLFHIEYMSHADASNLGLPVSSVDFHISYNVLEHIPPDVIVNILKEGSRVVRDDGLFIHRIDFSDHFSHTDSSITSINFLQFSDEEWKRLVGNWYMYVNRLRVDDMADIFTSRCKQRIIYMDTTTDVSLLTLMRDGELELDDRFSSKSEEALITTGCWIASAKNR